MTLLKKIFNHILSKNFLINVGAILLIYVVGVIILRSCLKSSTNFGEKIEVPNLIGQNQGDLDKLLAGTSLKYEVLDSIYDPKKVEGTILAQDPKPSFDTDVFVKADRTIKVSVSKRSLLVEVPDLIDKSQRFAENILRNRKFKYKLDYKPSKEAHGAVIEQLYKNKPIEAGKKLPIGSSIKLIVGRDELGVPQLLPNLYGLTIDEARKRVGNMLNMEFLPVYPVDVNYTSADSLNARVVSQSPEFSEGAQVVSGSTITVFATKEFTEEPAPTN